MPIRPKHCHPPRFLRPQEEGRSVAGRCCEPTSVIATTNLPFEQWTEMLGSERLTGAMLDRLTHRVHILEANGVSYRLEQAKVHQRKQSTDQPQKSPFSEWKGKQELTTLRPIAASNSLVLDAFR